jgi:carotenoid cleavage dioxygenase-like enzyme
MKSDLSRRGFIHLSAAALAGASSPLWLTGCSDGNSNDYIPFDKIPLPQDAQGRWWLSNNYAPVQEEHEEFNLKIIGELPRALNGLYARVGSNGEDTNHWFLGHGMLHGLRLQDGQALWYRNRYINTLLHQDGTDDLNPGDPVSSYSNVAPIYHANKLLTMGEIGYPYETSVEDLTTIGVYNFDGKLKGSMTAHPKIDPLSGEMLFFGYGFAPPYVTYYQANAQGEIERSVDITLPAAVMMHDFAITENYVIFYDLPVVFDFDLVTAGSDFPFSWDPDHIPRMGVMPRDGGDADIQWFEVENCFIFHTMNAHENPNNSLEIILDASRIDAPFWDVTNQDLSKPSYLTRYRFDLENGTVSENRINDIPMDFGQLNRRLIGQNYRYGYGMDFSELADDNSLPRPKGIVRQDHQSGGSDRHYAAPGLLLDEALFAPDPGSSGEQDGWLMCFAFNEERCLSDLLVIDARDFTGAPVARVELPFRVPFGFHGVWVADEA